MSCIYSGHRPTRRIRISRKQSGIGLTVRSADSHVRSTPRGSVYVVFTMRAQRASLGSCLVKLVSHGLALYYWWYHPKSILYIADWDLIAEGTLGENWSKHTNGPRETSFDLACVRADIVMGWQWFRLKEWEQVAEIRWRMIYPSNGVQD